MADQHTEDQDIQLFSDWVAVLLSRYLEYARTCARQVVVGRDMYGEVVDDTRLEVLRTQFEEALKALELAKQIAGRD